MFDRKLYKTEIEIDDDEHLIAMRLYAPQYEYNCISLLEEMDCVHSQILTNSNEDFEKWMKDNEKYHIVRIDSRQRYKDGAFELMSLVEWADLLDNLREYMDDESITHVDAAFQM